MTSVTPPSQPSRDAVPPLIFQHDAEALALEDEAALMSAGVLHNQLQDITRRFAQRWVTRWRRFREKADGPEATQLTDDLSQALAGLHIDPSGPLLDYANRAARLGVQQGFVEAGLDARELDVPTPFTMTARVAGVAAAAQRRIDRAASMASTLTPGTFNQTVLVPVGQARQAAAVVERAARSIVNEQLNAGLSAAAKTVGALEIWVAERDACLTCLAVSGHSVGENGTFADGTAFGGYRAQHAGIGFVAPPAHDNCRCRLTVYFGHDTAGAESITHDWAGAIEEARERGDVVAEEAAHRAAEAARRSAAFDLPSALRREAERSVLHGWALPSESSRLRTRAADALLTRISARDGYSPSGWKVPKSVKKSTENRLKKGTFGTTPFPH